MEAHSRLAAANVMHGMILGAGVAGLCTALALRQRGTKLALYEAAPEYRAVGAGLVLSLNGTAVLQRLGLLEEAVTQGCVLERMQFTDAQLQPISENLVGHFSWRSGLPFLAMHRNRLLNLLWRQVADQVHFNHPYTDLELNPEGARVRFADGSSASADYVLAADGSQSLARQRHIDPRPLREAKQICWRGIARTPLPYTYRRSLLEAWGPGRRFGFCQIDQHDVYWYALIDTEQSPPSAQATPACWLGDQYLNFHPLVRQLISSTPSGTVVRHAIRDLPELPNWYKGRLCLMGDAAHAITPNLGQGACQALEDGLRLAEALCEYPTPEGAFAAFQRRRQQRVEFISRESYRIGRLGQMRNPVLRALRDTLIPYLPREKVIRRMNPVYELGD